MTSLRWLRSLQLSRFGFLFGLMLLLGACVDLTPPWQITSMGDGAVAQASGGEDGQGGPGGAGGGSGEFTIPDVADASAQGGGAGSGVLAGNGGSSTGQPEDGGAGGCKTGGAVTGGTSGANGGVTGSGGIPSGGKTGGSNLTGGTSQGGKVGGSIMTGGASQSGNVGGFSVTGGASQGGNVGGSSLTGTTGTPSCAPQGVPDSGICWYYGLAGASCSKTCESHGGVSPEAPSHIGTPTQGGSLVECARLFILLGVTGTVNSATRSDGAGLGCHMYPSGSRVYFWLTSPSYSDRAAVTNARIVCGCVR